jgi:hypothetical protein
MFSDDLKIYRFINNVQGSKRLQSDINSVQNRCFENGMILNVGKTAILYSTRKNVSIKFNYKLCTPIILFYVPCVSDILEFCWTVSSIFITTLTTYFLMA